MKKFRRTLSMLLCAALLLSGASFASEAAYEKDSRFTVINRVDEQNGDITTYRFVDENGNEVTPVKGKNAPPIRAINYPQKYDARDRALVTPVKNQDPFGTCWAFAFCAAAETSLIKQGFETADSVDISESHLVYYTYHSCDGEIHREADRDGINEDDFFTLGGNSQAALATAAKWSGLAKESDYPYMNDVEKMTSLYSTWDYSDKYVSDYQLVSCQTEAYLNSIQGVKRAVTENGSAAISFAFFDECFLGGDGSMSTYCCNEASMPNHGVLVVGWDDNFSNDFFAEDPGRKGAWLCKNSWGTEWGDEGYFWLSYYDSTIYEYTKLTAVPAGSYVNNYQYDGYVPSAMLACMGSQKIYMANIFTSEGNEYVSGAGFTTLAGVGYKASVSLYTDLKNADDPTSGTLKETVPIMLEAPGYYTVDFNGRYELDEWEKFSVVVMLDSNSDVTYLTLEGRENSVTHYASNENESFVSYEGESWQPSPMNNVPVKAFTSAVRKVESIQLNTLPTKTAYYAGNSFDTSGLSLKVTFEDGTTEIISKGYTWTGDSLDTAGEKTVYIRYGGAEIPLNIVVWEMPSNIVKGISVSDFKIDYKKTAMIPVEIDAPFGTQYYVTYATSHPNVAYADANGNLYGVSRGNSTITCTVTDIYGNTYTDSCNVRVRWNFWQWVIIILLFGWIWYI